MPKQSYHDDNPFGDCHLDDEQFAVKVTGEHDSEPFQVWIGGATSWRKCSACGQDEKDDVDGDTDGTYASIGPNLDYCSNHDFDSFNGCDCAVHPACARTIGEKQGLCPHCAWLENENLKKQMEDEFLLERVAYEAASDVKHLREMLSNESDVTKRETVNEVLREIAQTVVDTMGENGAAIVRSTLQALPLAEVA